MLKGQGEATWRVVTVGVSKGAHGPDDAKSSVTQARTPRGLQGTWASAEGLNGRPPGAHTVRSDGKPSSKFSPQSKDNRRSRDPFRLTAQSGAV